MRIALATTQVPFVRGGAELLTESLQRELITRGHEVEIVRVPFNWYPGEKLQACMQANSLLDLDQLGGHRIDRVIGLKFPAYLMQHPDKVFWLIHQHRQAYERWDRGDSDLRSQQNGQAVRNEIMHADRAAFANHPVFTISKNVSYRLHHYLSIDSTPLYHPPPIAPWLHPGEESDDFVLVPGRLGPDKRQDLVLQALAECREPVRAVFVGAADCEEFGRTLQALAKTLKLEHRVQWRQGLSGEELAALYRKAVAVVFTPVDEDYGYVTLEAMLAAKPLLTVADAGGPLEFIEHEEQGLVAAADAKAIAIHLSQLWADRALAKRLGEKALLRYHELDIGWDGVISALLQPAAPKIENIHPVTSPLEDQGLMQRAGISTLAELLNSFDFGDHIPSEVASYLQGHWPRFVETAQMLPEFFNPRILDLGSAKPHVFLGLTQLIYRDARFSAVAETHYDSFVMETYAARRQTKDLCVETTSFNVETTVFPYPDHSFDLVLAMEIIEHLVLNPAHMFAEIARVFRPGGTLILTTPNIVSDMALKKLVLGHAPYSFGVFIPYHGVYGRHNREYTPHEIESLGLSVGLATHALLTKDVYADQIGDAHEFAGRVPGLRNPVALRGQNIFYRSVKSSDASPVAPPSSMYLEDPRDFRGFVKVNPSAEVLHIVFGNHGAREWSGQSISLLLTLYADDGREKRAIRLAFPCLVPPGEERCIALPIAPLVGEPCCIMTMALERTGRGDLNKVGVGTIRLVVRADAFEQLAQSFAVSSP